jgi:hypothetical protein
MSWAIVVEVVRRMRTLTGFVMMSTTASVNLMLAAFAMDLVPFTNVDVPTSPSGAATATETSWMHWAFVVATVWGMKTTLAFATTLKSRDALILMLATLTQRPRRTTGVVTFVPVVVGNLLTRWRWYHPQLWERVAWFTDSMFKCKTRPTG